MGRNQEHKMTIPKDKLIDIYYNEYLNGSSMVVLGKKYNISPSYFGMWFKKLNFPVRSNKENSRKYKYNENYFESIDSEDKAYWLGFIYADGYVSTTHNQKRLGIALKIDDYNHLVKFNSSLESEYPISIYTSNGSYGKVKYCRVVITGSKIVDDIIRQGVVENKTNILTPPQFLPKNLTKHFIRGYFDGDGSVWKQHSKLGTVGYSISFIGTDSILMFIMNYLFNEGLIKRYYPLNKRKSDHIVSNFKFGGNILTYTVLNHLYNNSATYLERKYNIFKELENLINSRS